MTPFSFARARDANTALAFTAPGSCFIAGGTTLVDLMREGVEKPGLVVDINALPYREIAIHPDRLELGALARMSEVAAHRDVGRMYPAIAESLLLSASAQLRNMASLGGNLLQRTRCSYFRDVTAACNKRVPGAGCAARLGDNRMHAIFGGSEACVATHASDLAVALVALDATLRLESRSGERRVRLEDFYLLPDWAPAVENVLRAGELITAIEVPAGEHAARSTYLKVRDRESFEFAIVSAAVGLVTERGRVHDVRIAVGGVATRPWRLRHVEHALIGGIADRDHFDAVSELALTGAEPLAHNGFKLELLPRVIARALEDRRGQAVSDLVGAPLPRVDGRAKVAGQARYAADHLESGAAHAVIVSAAIGKGRVRSLAHAEIMGLPGVLAVLTHETAPRLAYLPHKSDVDPEIGERLHVLQDDQVRHFGQPIAVIVADTLEQAQHAALRLRVEYDAGEPELGLAHADDDAVAPQGADWNPADYTRGTPASALAAAEHRIQAEYRIARENHNAIEPHATVARWDGPRLTVWEKSQWVTNARAELAAVLGIDPSNVRVVCPFVGGAFGSALRTWPHAALAALAAHVVRRPVRLVLTRKQMFLGTGFRPACLQRVQAGATRDGRLVALDVESYAETSRYEEFAENMLSGARMLYACPNVATRERVVPRDIHTPTHMRAPGQASGIFALECALDELAHACGMDPVDLRLRNLAERDLAKNLPFSSCGLADCLALGRERIQWSRRVPRPGALHDGRWRVGLGMAAVSYPVNRDTASATVRLRRDGTARIETASSDMGPGTYTSLTQVAASALDLPPERIALVLGDSQLPPTPPHGGSQTMASVGSAVQAACLEAREKLVEGRDEVTATARSGPGDEEKRFSMYAFGAVFAEVGVDVDFGIVRVRRIAGAYAAGRIVNPLLARSQALGGMVGGIGMALLEATLTDPRDGRITNANLADYRIPVNADVPELDVAFVPESDPHVNPLGVKGVAEIAYVGVAPAIANAVWNATGRRIRELPIRPELLL